MLKYLGKIDSESASFLFNKYSETFVDESEESIKALSFHNYMKMVTNNAIFSKEDFNSFCKLDQKPIKTHIRELLLDLPNKMLELKCRYEEHSDIKTLQEVNVIIGVLSSKIAKSDSSDATWLAYRLIEEESKGVCVEGKLREFLPLISLIIK